MQINFNNLRENIASNYNSLVDILNESVTADGFNIGIFNAGLVEERIASLRSGIEALICITEIEGHIDSLPDIKLSSLKRFENETSGK